MMKLIFNWLSFSKPGRECPLSESLDICEILHSVWGITDAGIIETQRVSDTDVRYRIQTPRGGYYLKLQPAGRYRDPELLNALYGHLRDAYRKQALPARTEQGGFFHRQGSQLAFLTPLLDFRPFSRGISDLTDLAASLGAFHRALKGFPLKHRVQENSLAFKARQAETRKQVLAAVGQGDFSQMPVAGSWCRENKDRLALIARAFNPGLFFRGSVPVYPRGHPSRQCIVFPGRAAAFGHRL
jgi:hypothetical protein